MKPFRLKFQLKYLVVIALALVLFGNSGFRRLVKNYFEHRRLAGEKARLEVQRKDLEKQLKEVREKPAVEHAARKELSMLKPDETEYRFPRPKDSDK
ncbi:MAG: FtsB family cell division protein [Elusimicrobiales bacterium]